MNKLYPLRFNHEVCGYQNKDATVLLSYDKDAVAWVLMRRNTTDHNWSVVDQDVFRHDVTERHNYKITDGDSDDVLPVTDPTH